MKVKIRETNEIVGIYIYSKQGIEWTQDLLGNGGAFLDGQFVWDDDEDIYVADRGTVDWWWSYIDDYYDVEWHITDLAERLGLDRDKICMQVGDAQDDDYTRHREIAMQVLEEIEAEYNSRMSMDVSEFADVVACAYVAQYMSGAHVMGEPVIYYNKSTDTVGWCSSLTPLSDDDVRITELFYQCFGDVGDDPEVAREYIKDYVTNNWNTLE